MPTLRTWAKTAGYVLHFLVGAVMILSAMRKLAAPVPPETAEKLGQGLMDNLMLITVGELVTALLLMIPRTSSLGVLLASSFWGGAICFHMAHGDPYVLQSVLLVMTWIGGGCAIPDYSVALRGRRKALPNRSLVTRNNRGLATRIGVTKQEFGNEISGENEN